MKNWPQNKNRVVHITCLSDMSGESGLKSGVIAGVAPGVVAARGRTVDDIEAVDSRDDTDIARRRKGRRGMSKSSSSS